MKNIRRLFVAAIFDMLFFGIAYTESALDDSIARVEFDKGENGITANVRYNSNSASGKAIFAYTDKYGRLKNANVQTVSVLNGTNIHTITLMTVRSIWARGGQTLCIRVIFTTAEPILPAKPSH